MILTRALAARTGLVYFPPQPPWQHPVFCAKILLPNIQMEIIFRMEINEYWFSLDTIDPGTYHYSFADEWHRGHSFRPYGLRYAVWQACFGPSTSTHR